MIKVIAIITMLLDHIGIIFFPETQLLRIFGRLSMPLFAWGITRGYRVTKNFQYYAFRLFVLALISQLPYYFVFKNGYLNICFTLFSGLIFLKLYSSHLSWFIKNSGLLAILLMAQFFHLEFGIYGVLTIFIFYKFWENDKAILYQAGLTLISVLIFKYDPIQLFAALSIFLIMFFKQKDFRLHKYFQYGFYPVHLILLGLIKLGGNILWRLN